MKTEGEMREGRYKITMGTFCEGHSLIISHSEGVYQSDTHNNKQKTSPGNIYTWGRKMYFSLHRLPKVRISIVRGYVHIAGLLIFFAQIIFCVCVCVVVHVII